MLKKLGVIALVLGSCTTVMAAGCSSSSDTNGGGSSDTDAGGGGSKKDGGGTSGEDGGGFTSDGGNGGKKDAGGTTNEDSGITTPKGDAGPVFDDGGVVKIDAGAADAGDAGAVMLADGGSAPACYDVANAYAGYTNATATTAGQNLCNPTQISTFYDYYFNGNTKVFDTTNASNQSCQRCLIGPTSASDTSPFPYPALLQIDAAGDNVVNLAGCYAALSTGTASCNTNFTAYLMCAQSACSTCSTSDFSACLDANDADDSGCYSVDTFDATCSDAISAAEKVAANQTKCGSGKTFQQQYTAVATTLCGP